MLRTWRAILVTRNSAKFEAPFLGGAATHDYETSHFHNTHHSLTDSPCLGLTTSESVRYDKCFVVHGDHSRNVIGGEHTSKVKSPLRASNVI